MANARFEMARRWDLSCLVWLFLVLDPIVIFLPVTFHASCFIQNQNKLWPIHIWPGRFGYSRTINCLK